MRYFPIIGGLALALLFFICNLRGLGFPIAAPKPAVSKSLLCLEQVAVVSLDSRPPEGLKPKA